jgi:hypothetical protein
MNDPKCFLLLCAALFFTASHSDASLGDRVDSIDRDQRTLHGMRKLRRETQFTVHEINSKGHLVQEFVSPDGIVFAVTWKGVSQPDLSVLFGTYFNEYRNASTRQKRPKGRVPIVLETSNIVVERFGHMRDVRGRAYVPDLLPEGVTPEEIRSSN